VEGEAGSRFFQGQPDAESVVATAAKYGIEIPSPIEEETQSDDALRAAAPWSARSIPRENA
jgi:hypothetical protein